MPLLYILQGFYRKYGKLSLIKDIDTGNEIYTAQLQPLNDFELITGANLRVILSNVLKVDQGVRDVGVVNYKMDPPKWFVGQFEAQRNTVGITLKF